MAIKWETEEPTPQVPRIKLDHGPLTLSITPGNHHNPNELWQWVSVSLGKHTTASRLSCRGTWPREAIALVREALDKFEEELDNHEVVAVAREVGDIRNFQED